jgi:hypothetical protein
MKWIMMMNSTMTRSAHIGKKFLGANQINQLWRNRVKTKCRSRRYPSLRSCLNDRQEDSALLTWWVLQKRLMMNFTKGSLGTMKVMKVSTQSKKVIHSVETHLTLILMTLILKKINTKTKRKKQLRWTVRKKETQSKVKK